ncbi:MAG TPA: M20/M25/M40 family metallo-hydrolase [Ignavibacteriaceae bacterium]|nr:M20/M25/M40 family metallo-hydrolase [Ignavibacteriaceae bacterium]
MKNPDRLIEIFISLVKIEALSGNEKPVADFIRSFLAENSLTVMADNSYLKSKSNTGNLICIVEGGGDSVFLSHMDTARSTKDVRPVLTGDRIISSGDTVLGVDNRSGIAVLLFTMEKIIKEKINTKGFTLAFTTCEETTLLGSRNLELNRKIKKGFVFDSSLRPGNFINSACGALGFKVIIKGKASHSAIAPEKGINSIEAASKAVAKIQQGRIDRETTLNIGRIAGGSAVNVIPEETVVEGEIRSFKIEKITKLLEKVKNIFEHESAALSAKVEFQYEWDFKPYVVSSDLQVYKEIVEALKKTGLSPQPNSSLAGSDANSLNEIGIPSVNIGIGAQNPHSNDEFIYIEDLIKAADIAFELIKKE